MTHFMSTLHVLSSNWKQNCYKENGAISLKNAEIRSVFISYKTIGIHLLLWPSREKQLKVEQRSVNTPGFSRSHFNT